MKAATREDSSNEVGKVAADICLRNSLGNPRLRNACVCSFSDRERLSSRVEEPKAVVQSFGGANKLAILAKAGKFGLSSLAFFLPWCSSGELEYGKQATK